MEYSLKLSIVGVLLLSHSGCYMDGIYILQLWNSNTIVFYYLGAATISPPEIALVCIGEQLELTCNVTGNQLGWRFSAFRENEKTATDFYRIIPSSVSASAAMSRLMINSTMFSFSMQDICQRQYTGIPVESSV